MRAGALKTTLIGLGTAAVLCLGIWWGGHPTDLPSFLRNAFVANPHDVVIEEALSDIQDDWYRTTGRGGLINGAIAGAVASLNDPYAQYETPAQFNSFNNPSPQQFSGVGIDVAPVKAGLLVSGVLPQSPASGAGMRVGDVITSVNGRAIAAIGSTAGISLIRGRAGTRVTLGVRRGTRALTFSVTRRVIDQPIVEDAVTSSHGVKLGILYLPTFDVPGVHAEVATDLHSLLRQGVRGIVLDLRENRGGLVTEAQLVTSMFLSHGVIVTTRARGAPSSVVRATGQVIAPTIPLVVLVNADTASAAEIVTGALRDHHRATIVGTRTYGKGVFQEIIPLSNGGAVDITVGHYFLPDGENLGAGGLRRGPGIKPDVTVTRGPGANGDPQLEAALAVLVARAH